MGRTQFFWLVSLVATSLLCSYAKEDLRLYHIGIPYNKNVWVDYIFDEANPEKSIVIVNPYRISIKGKHGGGINNRVVYQNWTCEPGGTEYGYRVDMRGSQQSFDIGGVGRFDKGRFLVLRDPQAKELPKQMNISIPGGLTTEDKLRKWLDDVLAAGGSLGEQAARGDGKPAPHP